LSGEPQLPDRSVDREWQKSNPVTEHQARKDGHPRVGGFIFLDLLEVRIGRAYQAKTDESNHAFLYFAPQFVARILAPLARCINHG